MDVFNRTKREKLTLGFQYALAYELDLVQSKGGFLEVRQLYRCVPRYFWRTRRGSIGGFRLGI